MDGERKSVARLDCNLACDCTGGIAGWIEESRQTKKQFSQEFINGKTEYLRNNDIGGNQ